VLGMVANGVSGVIMSSKPIEQEILERLNSKGVSPLVGGLIAENSAADLLGYAPSYFRRLAANGNAVIPFVMRGNRRLYRICDIALFVTKTVL
jgi:hypothetical protein